MVTARIGAAGRLPDILPQFTPPSSVRHMLPVVNPPNTISTVSASCGETKIWWQKRLATSGFWPWPLIKDHVGLAAVPFTERQISRVRAQPKCRCRLPGAIAIALMLPFEGGLIRVH